MGGKGVGNGVEYGYVVLRVRGDHGDRDQAGWAVRAADKDVRLASIPEGFKNVGSGEQVALLVDKEGVTEEDVVVAVGGRGFVKAINNRADGGDGIGFGRRGCGKQGQGGDHTGEVHEGKVARGRAGGKGGKGTGAAPAERRSEQTELPKRTLKRGVEKARRTRGQFFALDTAAVATVCSVRTETTVKTGATERGRGAMGEQTGKETIKETGAGKEAGKVGETGLSPVAQKFILHWGEMGTRWGINRTVAQVHALLFLSPGPVPADEISTTLAVARSNVSTSLRELQGWGIVRMVHVLGDRREHFESTKDVWEIFRIVSEERKRREIDPTLRVIGECVAELKANPQGDRYTRERLESMLEFLTVMSGLFEEVMRMPIPALKGVGKLRGKVITLLGSDKKKAG
jgi:DNA-binding transcriptional regulator GbsR (MarR family)